jgi:hypothetical protein
MRFQLELQPSLSVIFHATAQLAVAGTSLAGTSNGTHVTTVKKSQNLLQS